MIYLKEATIRVCILKWFASFLRLKEKILRYYKLMNTSRYLFSSISPCSGQGLNVEALIPTQVLFYFFALVFPVNLLLLSLLSLFVVVSGYWQETKWNNKRRHFSSCPGQQRTQVSSFEFWLIRQTSERAEDTGSCLFRISSSISAEPPLLKAWSPSAVANSQDPLPEIF